MLVGTAAGDDAGVFDLGDGMALVQTVDVLRRAWTIAELFGQIAAANSVSDVYAMGGRPISALSIVGFPIDELDGSVMEAMLRGGLAKLGEADCALIGGHSINDEEVKCGFAVTGLIEKGRAVERDRARPGDVLVLTKPLGTGMVSFAAQLGLADEEVLAEVGRWMAALNKDAARADGEAWGACLHRCDRVWAGGASGIDGAGKRGGCGDRPLGGACFRHGT